MFVMRLVNILSDNNFGNGLIQRHCIANPDSWVGFVGVLDVVRPRRFSVDFSNR